MFDPATLSTDSFVSRRVTALQKAVAENGLDALAVTSPANRHYLAGIPTSAGLAFVSPEGAWFLTDSRYYEAVRRRVPHFQLVEAGYKTWEGLANLIGTNGPKRIGFEADTVTVTGLKDMQTKVPGAEWVPVSGLVEALRMIKSADELALIAKAAKIADDAVVFAYDAARAGQTERQLAWLIEAFMRENGADGMAFEIIVAAGENGASPHHSPTDRPIAVGEPIVLDLGARVDGYNSDITRTFCIGDPSDGEYDAVWDLVYAAEQRAIAELRPGMSGVAVDALARDLIQAAGHGDHFGHGLGHGVGLNVHEGPRVTYTAPESPIPAGSVITIEPGVYLPGRFGVRLEDLVVVTATGGRCLSQAPFRRTVPNKA